MNNLSIKDIAKLAGVAPATVSFVLNGKAKEMRISQEKTEKIQQIIKETGYSPNRSAVSLRTGKTYVIGLIVEDISNSFFSQLAKCIELTAYQAGYRVIYCSTENDSDKGVEFIKMLHKQVDGFIITPTTGMKAQAQKLQKHDKPLVFVDRYFPDLTVPYALVDNYEGVSSGIEYLVNKEYQRIGYVTIISDQIQMEERSRGYVEQLKKSGRYRKELVLRLPFSPDESDYEKKIAAFIKKQPTLDAIFFATNYLGIQGLKVLKKMQKKIPEEIAVMVFDDHDIFQLYSSPISVLQQPIDDIARQGVHMILRQMNPTENPAPDNGVLIHSKLIIRAST